MPSVPPSPKCSGDRLRGSVSYFTREFLEGDAPSVPKPQPRTRRLKECGASRPHRFLTVAGTATLLEDALPLRMRSPPLPADCAKNRLKNPIRMLLNSRPDDLALFIVNRNNRADRRTIIDESFEFGLFKSSTAVDRHTGLANLERSRRCRLDDLSAVRPGVNPRGRVSRRHRNFPPDKQGGLEGPAPNRLAKIPVVGPDLLLFLVRGRFGRGRWRRPGF